MTDTGPSVQLGAEVRQFLLGLLQSAEGPSLKASFASSTPYDPQGPLVAPDPSKIVVGINVAAQLPTGSLIFGTQINGKLYRYTPDTRETEIVAAFYNTPMALWHSQIMGNGEILVAMSGTRRNDPDNPFELLWGQGGCIVRLDVRDESFSVIPTTDQMTDPSHLQLLPNGALAVADFEGFGGSGAIYQVDPVSGARTIIARGSPLKDPCSCTLGADGNLYVANPAQLYTYDHSGGDWQRDTGSIVRVELPSGAMTVVYDESSAPLGALVGVVTTPDPDKLILVRGDWPSLVGSALLVLDLKTGQSTPIISASESKPRFFGHDAAVVKDTVLYAVDSYQKEFLTIDLTTNSVTSIDSVTAILGSTLGMTTSVETIEWIELIP